MRNCATDRHPLQSHLSCVYENNGPTPDWVKSLADRYHKPIWDTEEHVYLDGYRCELMLVKAFNVNFIDASATRTVKWYLEDSIYGVEPYKIRPGMLVADSPWSGHSAVARRCGATRITASSARSAGSIFPTPAAGCPAAALT